MPEQQPAPVAVHGPYEDLGIRICDVIIKAMEGQDAATRKELWTRYLEFSKPLHELAVAATKDAQSWFKPR